MSNITETYARPEYKNYTFYGVQMATEEDVIIDEVYTTIEEAEELYNRLANEPYIELVLWELRGINYTKRLKEHYV